MLAISIKSFLLRVCGWYKRYWIGRPIFVEDGALRDGGGAVQESDAGIAREAGLRAGLIYCKRWWPAPFRVSLVLPIV